MFTERPNRNIISRQAINERIFRTAKQDKSGRRSAGPESAVDVAAVLLAYLQRRLGLDGLSYSADPTPVANGWEAYIFTFRLQGTGLPQDWDRPLMLRIHASSQGLVRARHEFQVQRHLVRLGYPAPETLLLEESCDLFGGPFLIMERISGPTVLEAMLQRPWRPLLFPRMMAAAQARLHNLPADGFPAPPGPFLARHLDQLRATIDQYDFSGLAPGLEWLQTHRPPEPARASILHLDLHPLNLIERSDGLLAVIDWTYSDCGDPHADVATTLFIQECFPVDGASVWQRLAIVLGRPLVAACYLRAYRHHRPLDDGRLAYYRAWAALRALARYARCARAGPEVCDTRAALVSHLAPDLLAGLCRYFRRWTGVAVKL